MATKKKAPKARHFTEAQLRKAWNEVVDSRGSQREDGAYVTASGRFHSPKWGQEGELDDLRREFVERLFSAPVLRTTPSVSRAVVKARLSALAAEIDAL